MIKQPCAIAGCQRLAKSHLSKLCGHHIEAKRNYGHPEQRPIRMTDLQPYLRRISAWRKTVQLDLWPAIDAQWSTMVVPLAQENLQAWGENAKFRRAAAREVLAIDSGVEDKTKIVDLNLAIWMFAQEHKTRFVDPICLVHALAKMTRRLCPSATRRKFDVTTGSNQSWAKYASARSLHQLGRWLIDAYGAAGVTLATTQFNRKQEARKQTERMREAVAALAAIGERAETTA